MSKIRADYALQLIAFLKQEINKKYSGKLLYAVVSGAHLYGFESPDSDIDIRGSFIANSHQFFGLNIPKYKIMDAKH